MYECAYQICMWGLLYGMPGWRHVLGLSFIGPNVAAAFGPLASCLRLQLSAKPFWATWSGCQKKGNKNNGRQFILSPDRTRPGTRNQTPAPRTGRSRWSRQFTVTRPRDLLNQLAAVAPCTLTMGPTTCRCFTDYAECIHSILKSKVNKINWLYMFTCHILPVYVVRSVNVFCVLWDNFISMKSIKLVFFLQINAVNTASIL